MKTTKSKSIIVIAGPTAVGKTALAIEMALRYSGEIICADSRTVYKGMNVGTAKPKPEECQKVQHHGLDLVTPEQVFTAGDFKRYAQKTIKEIHDRNHLVFIVGGSGLYIDTLVYDFDLAAPPVPSVRKAYTSKSLRELQNEAKQKEISVSSETYSNARHLSRLLERGGNQPKKHKLPPNVLYLGLKMNKELLNARIETRAQIMLEQGFVKEVKLLLKKYDASLGALQTPGYRPFIDYVQSLLSIEEATQKFIQSDKKLAKRQMTWFKKNPDVRWVNSSQEAEQQIKKFLQKFDTI